MKIPSSIDIARRLIKDNFELFNPEEYYLAEVVIAKALRDYYEQSREYALQDQPKINEIKEQLKTLNNL